MSNSPNSDKKSNFGSSSFEKKIEDVKGVHERHDTKPNKDNNPQVYVNSKQVDRDTVVPVPSQVDWLPVYPEQGTLNDISQINCIPQHNAIPEENAGSLIRKNLSMVVVPEIQTGQEQAMIEQEPKMDRYNTRWTRRAHNVIDLS